MNIFLKVGILSFVVLSLGIFIGFRIDNLESENTDQRLDNLAFDLNSILIQENIYQKIGENSLCNERFEGNLDFNRKIYDEGLELETLERVNKLGPDVLEKKERYALLQLQFWSNSIEIKKSCDLDYENIIYFYKHYSTTEDDITQNVQSSILTELKNECGNKILLIPLPADLEINTIDTIKNYYNITEYPSILIDEKIILQGTQDTNSIKQHISC